LKTFTLRPLHFRANFAWYPLSGPHSTSGYFGEDFNTLSPPVTEPSFLRLLSVCMVSIPTELFRLPLRYLYKDPFIIIFSYLYRKERVVTSVPISLSAGCGRLLAGIAGSNPDDAWISVSCECCVLSGRGPCDGPIPRPEKSSRVWCD